MRAVALRVLGALVLCTTLSASLSACELVADFDRSKLVTAVDGGDGDGDGDHDASTMAGSGGMAGTAGNDASAGSGGAPPVDDDAGDDDAGQ